MALKPVTDPGLLSQLNGAHAPAASPGRRPVTDPALLAQLNSEPAAESTSDYMLRQVARTGKAAAQGVVGLTDYLPSLPNVYNKFVEYTGKPEADKMWTPMIGLNRLLDHEMLTPQTAGERVSDDVVRGVTSAATSAGGMGTLAQGGGRMISMLAANPGQQAIAGGAAAGAAGLAREEGASPMQQAGIGLVGGVGAGMGAATTNRMLSGAKAFIDPFRAGGREAIAGRVLNEAANSPTRSMRAMANPRELVQGSAPTAAEASADAGLANFEDRLKNLEPGKFTARQSAQNEARDRLLESVAGGGTRTEVQRLESMRDQLTTPLRDQAFKQAAGKPVNTHAVLDDIDELMANPENAGESVQKALQAVRRQLAGESKTHTTGGITVTEQVPVTDARALYSVRKEINRILEGKYVGSDESVLRYAGSQLGKVKSSIDDAISEVAPTWKQYLTRYSKLSRPIERAETVGDIRQKTAMAAPDLQTGRDVISQAKWRSSVRNALPELEKTLTPQQMTRLNAITADLDRGAAATAASKRVTAGSQTAANIVAKEQMSVANVLGRLLGRDVKEIPTWLATASRPLAFINKLADQQIRELLVDAMLDPRLAARLMQRGTPENIKSFASSVAQNLGRSGAQGVQGVDEPLQEMRLAR